MDFPKTKLCYVFDPDTGMFVGTSYGYLEPPFDKAEYYAPANSVYVKPRGEAERGKGYKINEKRTGWLLVENWAGWPLWYKATAMEAPQVAPGARLPDDVTAEEPPPFNQGEWPRWDNEAAAWSIGPNNQGVQWFHSNGTEGTLSCPWEEIPEGAQIGQSTERKQARMRVAQKRLLSDANDLIELCQEMVEAPGAKTGDAELLAQAKAYKREILQIDTTCDPDTFVEPQFPHVRFGLGEPLGE